MTADELDLLFNRDEALAGLPTKRADTLLFLIESRTGHLMERAREDAQRLVTATTARERNLAFIEAFALGRDSPIRPTIQDLERYSQQWASLVPENARVRAAIAHKMGERYQIAHGTAPGLRAALGLDAADVRQAYRKLFGKPLETVFTTQLGLRARVRWKRTALLARIDGLSPFWTSFALTLTETVGATILALPIALSTVGPLGGVLALVVIGLLNIATVAFMAEAVARSGRVHHGGAVYIGGLVEDYLGRAGSLILSTGLFVLLLLILPAFYVGASTTLEEAMGLPAPIGVGAIVLVGFFFLRRKSLNATVASALVVGVVNIVLVAIFCVIAATHLEIGNLTFEGTPFLGGAGFDGAALGLVFGVVMASYFGHTSVILCGRLVLNRDPSGRALLRGCVAAQATAMFLYCIFILAVNGAVDRGALADETGTALVPLADVAGVSVLILGSVFVILGMGMGTIHFSLAIFNLVRERLPAERTGPGTIEPDGASLIGVLEMNDERANVVAFMLREGDVCVDQVADNSGLSKPETRDLLRSLMKEGLVAENDSGLIPSYSVVVRNPRRRVLPDEVWAAMDIRSDEPPTGTKRRTMRGLVQRLGPRGRFVLSAAPVIAAFAATEWMLLTDSASFTGLLSFVGAIVVTLLTGIFPILLLASSRRKGERSPFRVYAWLGHPIVLGVLYLFFFSSVVLHGLVIWDSPWEQAGALGVAAMILLTSITMARKGAFDRRATVELRSNADGDRTLFEITAGGQALDCLVDLEYRDDSKTLRAASGEIPRFGSLRRAVFKVDAESESYPGEVKVWVHQVTAAGGSVPIHCLLRVGWNGNTIDRDLDSLGGQVVLPLSHDDRIELVFD